MEGFKKLSEVNLSVPEPKSDHEFTHFSKLDNAGFVIDMVEEEETKSYWEAVIGPIGQVWKEVLDKQLNSLNKART
jgi:hypothetical protein